MSVSVGIVGLGYWGPNLLRNFVTTPGWTVKYGCDLAESNLAKARLRYPSINYTPDLAVLLEDSSLTALAIATPVSTHYAIAKAALEHGKHVLVEKPIAETSAQTDELTALARARGLHILVDHTFVFSAAVRKIRELSQKAELGDLYYFDSTRINLGLIQEDVNVLWDLAIHDLSILGEVWDLDTLQSLYAHGSSHYGRHAEIGHLHLSFTHGFEAHIHVSWLSPVKLRRTILGGTKKMVVFDDLQPSEKVRIYDTGIRPGATESSDPFFPVYRTGDVLIPKLVNTEPLQLEVAHFLEVVEGRQEPLVPAAQGRAIVRILELADESLATRRPVTV